MVAPLLPLSQDRSHLSTPPASQEEVEKNGGLLQTIAKMESPLSGRKFRFSTDWSYEDEKENVVPQPVRKNSQENIFICKV